MLNYVIIYIITLLTVTSEIESITCRRYSTSYGYKYFYCSNRCCDYISTKYCCEKNNSDTNRSSFTTNIGLVTITVIAVIFVCFCSCFFTSKKRARRRMLTYPLNPTNIEPVQCRTPQNLPLDIEAPPPYTISNSYFLPTQTEQLPPPYTSPTPSEPPPPYDPKWARVKTDKSDESIEDNANNTLQRLQTP
ncbi:hypothetical protein SNE40_014746 [Patella caerulea]|uniref:Vesicular, overexpressed in cancer, prosurvival protein 1 n=1 Tax=Patella caerulea TaxID=87958 RepID=A0AAN8JE65_PATCE